MVKKVFSKLFYLFLVFAVLATMIPSWSFIGKAIDTDVTVLNDELSENADPFASISTDQAKTGVNSYKCTTASGHDFWFMRVAGITGRDIQSVTSNGTTGALRFWIYVNNGSNVASWGTGQVQLGEWWDTNVYSWNNWQTQITDSGWNEIILPITSAAKIGTPNLSNITYFSVRTGDANYQTTAYIDDIKVTSASGPTVDTSKILDDEARESGAPYASISTDQAKVGTKSYKCTTAGGHDFWFIRTQSAVARDITTATSNGTAGALRFWIYVDNFSNVANWGVGQVQLGQWWDTNVYSWNDWQSQITDNGWNEIVLPITSSAKIGTPDLDNIVYFSVRTGNATYTATVYIDEIKVTTSTAKTVNLNLILDDESSESGAPFASVSTTQVKVGTKSYQCSSGTDGHDYWFMRVESSSARNISGTTSNGTTGALRFWIYVDNVSNVASWGTGQVQLGQWWDTNVLSWNSWQSQISKNGWNEIILPISSATKIGIPDLDNIKYFSAKIGDATYQQTVYIDNIQVTTSLDSSDPATQPDADKSMILDDEVSESAAPYASVTTEQAKIGDKSYKCYTGVDSHSYWFMNVSNIDNRSISTATSNGTTGALRFWIYVNNFTDVENWGDGQVELGQQQDTNVYIWNGWQSQITKTGWNEIILPISTAIKTGTPNPESITYFSVRTGAETHAVTVYIDKIQVTSSTESSEQIPTPIVNLNKILDDEASESAMPFAVVSNEQAKDGTNSYKCVSGGGNDFWFMRVNNITSRSIRSATSGGTAGALRFWIYVSDSSDVENWGMGQVQLGAWWDSNVFSWNGWQSQITKNGWNEIALPMTSAGKIGFPDIDNITYFSVRIGNTTVATVYIDNIRVSNEAISAPTYDLSLILDDENNENADPFAAVSTAQAKIGTKSYKCTSGGASEFWFMRVGNFAPRTIRQATSGGTAGTLRFWVYVGDINSVNENWGMGQVQLGAWWDTNVFSWNDWQSQIKTNGWNEIVLSFAGAVKYGSPNVDSITYFSVRTGNGAYQATVYIDEIHVTSEAAPVANVDKNKILDDEYGESASPFATVSREQAKDGTNSYKCTTGGTNEFWFMRAAITTPRNISAATSNGTSGTLRFWVYVSDVNNIEKWGMGQVQLGAWWDTNVFSWNDWQSQITQNGWNEIIISFSAAAKLGKPDTDNISYFSIRIGNSTHQVTVYIDNIHVSSEAAPAPKYDMSRILDDESGESASPFAVSTREMAQEGSRSYRCIAGGSNEFWFMRVPSIYGRNIREVTKNGTTGALRFWIYVKDASDVDSWKSGQVQLGAWWDTNVYSWNDWQSQIDHNGWNEIVLPFIAAGKMGNPDLDNITYFSVRTGDTKHQVTVYIDNIRITTNYPYEPIDTPTQKGALMFNSFDTMGGVVGLDNDKKRMINHKEKTQGNGSMEVVNNTGNFMIIYWPSKTYDISSYNCVEFDLYIEDPDFFNFCDSSSLELTSSGTCDVQEMTWGLKGMSFKHGWNHIAFSFSRSGQTVDYKGNPDIDMTKINYFRLFAINAQAFYGKDITWRIDNLVFTNNGLPALEKDSIKVNNDTGIDISIKAMDGILPSYGTLDIHNVAINTLSASVQKKLTEAKDTKSKYVSLFLTMDGIEYLPSGNVNIYIKKDGLSVTDKFAVYRTDINNYISKVKYNQKDGYVIIEETVGLASYLLCNTELDVTKVNIPNSSAPVKTSPIILIFCIAVLVLAAGTVTFIFIRRRKVNPKAE